jgi:hypothetical protein
MHCRCTCSHAPRYGQRTPHAATCTHFVTILLSMCTTDERNHCKPHDHGASCIDPSKKLESTTTHALTWCRYQISAMMGSKTAVLVTYRCNYTSGSTPVLHTACGKCPSNLLLTHAVHTSDPNAMTEIWSWSLSCLVKNVTASFTRSRGEPDIDPEASSTTLREMAARFESGTSGAFSEIRQLADVLANP